MRVRDSGSGSCRSGARAIAPRLLLSPWTHGGSFPSKRDASPDEHDSPPSLRHGEVGGIERLRPHFVLSLRERSLITCCLTPICSSPGTFSITNAFGRAAATTATNSRYKELRGSLISRLWLRTLRKGLARRPAHDHVRLARGSEHALLHCWRTDITPDGFGLAEVEREGCAGVRIDAAGQNSKARLAEALGQPASPREQINEPDFRHGNSLWAGSDRASARVVARLAHYGSLRTRSRGSMWTSQSAGPLLQSASVSTVPSG